MATLVVRLKWILSLLMISAILLGCAPSGAPPALGEPPPPQLCDPQNPTLSPLSNPEKVPVRYLDKDAISYEAAYKNPKSDQAFTITVTGLDEGVALGYLKEVRVCFEAIETKEGFKTDPWNAVGLDQILIEGVMKATGMSLIEPSSYSTLADMIKDLNGDVDKVLADAIENAKRAIDQALAEGKLTQQQAQETTSMLESTYKDALYAEGMPIVFEGPKSEAEILLENDQSLIIDMAWLRPTEASKEAFVVYYVIHPSINKNQVRNYKAKCQKSAKVRIRADRGSMTVYFWGFIPSYYYIGSKTASVTGTLYPSAMSCCSSAPNPSTYDVSVTGGQNESSYVIEGGWVEGSGGGCD